MRGASWKVWRWAEDQVSREMPCKGPMAGHQRAACWWPTSASGDFSNCLSSNTDGGPEYFSSTVLPQNSMQPDSHSKVTINGEPRLLVQWVGPFGCVGGGPSWLEKRESVYSRGISPRMPAYEPRTSLGRYWTTTACLQTVTKN